MKKILLWMLLLCLILAGCGKTGGESDTPVAPAVSPSIEQGNVETDWVELDTANGILTVRLPVAADSYYSWSWEIVDGTSVEPLNSSDASGVYVANFRGISDGESTVLLRYSCADALAETRTVRVAAENGKITEILSAERKTIEGVREDVLKPELMKLLADNSFEKIFSLYETMTVVGGEWDVENGEEIPVSHILSQYDMSAGILAYNDETEYYGVGNIYCSYRESDMIPGVYCTYDEMKDEAVVLLVDSVLGKDMVSNLWINRGMFVGAAITGIVDDEENNVCVMIVSIIDEITGDRVECNIFTDLDSGLISGLEKFVFDADSGEKIYAARANVIYDDYRILDAKACDRVFNSEDSCEVTFVVNPGQEDGYTHTMSFRKGTELGWSSAQEYVMYTDADCTQVSNRIDTGIDEVRVYVAKKG